MISHLLVEILTFAAFLASFVILMTVKAQRDGAFGPVAKWAGAAVLLTFMIKSLAAIVSEVAVVPDLGGIVVLVEGMTVPFMLLAVESTYERQSRQQLENARQHAERAREIAVHLMDATPSGILVLDEVGEITYANETACAVLDLIRGAEPGDVKGPGWTVRDIHGHEAPNFVALTGTRRLGGVPVRVTWPGGEWLVDLVVSTAPLESDAGTVAAFPMPNRTFSGFNRAPEGAHSGIM